MVLIVVRVFLNIDGHLNRPEEGVQLIFTGAASTSASDSPCLLAGRLPLDRVWPRRGLCNINIVYLYLVNKYAH